MNNKNRNTLLQQLLKRPIRDWDIAFGVSRPPYWCFWRWSKFKSCVIATRIAIAATLKYDHFPTAYIPRVDITDDKDGEVCLLVHFWGKPWS